MTRTLVISDLHIGCRGRTSVLTKPAVLDRLLAEIDQIDRLILLGDVVELLESRPTVAMEAAVPILQAIGARMGPDRDVVVVPGNHDRPLIRDWLRHHAHELTSETAVPADASPLMAALVASLAPARVEVRYPGVWLSPTVWATHGHYLDRHLVPVSAYGMVRGGRRRLPLELAAPYHYERSGRVHLSPVVRWLPSPLATVFEDVAELSRASTMPTIQRSVLNPRLAPLTARLLGTQMRRHSLPAMARVVLHLGIEADFVVFGHVHRLGPLPADVPSQWKGPAGVPQLVNTGSWLYEPLLLHRIQPPHPYWPGGAVSLSDGDPPRPHGLLDQLSATELH